MVKAAYDSKNVNISSPDEGDIIVTQENITIQEKIETNLKKAETLTLQKDSKLKKPNILLPKRTQKRIQTRIQKRIQKRANHSNF